MIVNSYEDYKVRIKFIEDTLGIQNERLQWMLKISHLKIDILGLNTLLGILSAYNFKRKSFFNNMKLKKQYKRLI